jgi:hypothetical protein
MGLGGTETMMLLLATILALQAHAAPVHTPSCDVAQLRLSVDGGDGRLDGMSHAGATLSIRNTGVDCVLPALPEVLFRDARHRTLAIARQSPIGMHPGPAMVPVRLAAGHRAAADLRWISAPVFPHGRSARATTLIVRFGTHDLRVPLKAVLHGAADKPITFDQSPLRAVEGMAAG